MIYKYLVLATVCLLAAAPRAIARQTNTPSPVRFEPSADTTVDVEVKAKWNMVSVPLIAADMHKDSLYPSSVSNAFAYDAGYAAQDPLVMGEGYWLKFDTAETIGLFGSAVHVDTFEVEAGWNMVGSISDPVAVGSIEALPGSMTLSNFWLYDNGYFHASDIVPGEGYWVKASESGSIVLDGGAVAAPRTAADPTSGLHRLVIEDARGMRQELWFGEFTGKITPDMAEMPPPPPAGAFDARFAAGTWVEFYSGGDEQRISAKVASAAYPLTVRWTLDPSDRREIVLNDAVRMKGTGSAVIDEPGPIGIRAGSAGVPAAYALRQNYPNPFNPVTVIAYDLPEESPVKIAVYDLLGREVAVLADGVQPAGSHEVSFDATRHTTGIYFYRMEAGDFSDTRKLVIMR